MLEVQHNKDMLKGTLCALASIHSCCMGQEDDWSKLSLLTLYAITKYFKQFFFENLVPSTWLMRCCWSYLIHLWALLARLLLVDPVSCPSSCFLFRIIVVCFCFFDLYLYAWFQVLYFKDFVPCSIAQSAVDALTSINWKSYGLALRSIADHDGCIMLEWENLPQYFHVHIAIHCYRRQYP